MKQKSHDISEKDDKETEQIISTKNTRSMKTLQYWYFNGVSKQILCWFALSLFVFMHLLCAKYHELSTILLENYVVAQLATVLFTNKSASVCHIQYVYKDKTLFFL